MVIYECGTMKMPDDIVYRLRKRAGERRKQMSPDAAERIRVYQEGQRSTNEDSAVCPYKTGDWRAGTWIKGRDAAIKYWGEVEKQEERIAAQQAEPVVPKSDYRDWDYQDSLDKQAEPVDAAEDTANYPEDDGELTQTQIDQIKQENPLTDTLDGMRDVFKQWEDSFAQERKDFWNSLTEDQQLLAFCEVVSRLVQGELVDKKSYRGVLYDTFEFGMQSYVQAQISGFLTLHNAIDPSKD